MNESTLTECSLGSLLTRSALFSTRVLILLNDPKFLDVTVPEDLPGSPPRPLGDPGLQGRASWISLSLVSLWPEVILVEGDVISLSDC